FGHALDQQAKTLFTFPKLPLVLSPLRQVTRDLRETCKSAVLIPKRGDHDVRPESRTILADAPTFVLESTLHSRSPQFLLRPTIGNPVRWIKPGHVRTYDFVRRVTLDTLGTGIPTNHNTLRVQHENCVITDPFDQ